MKIFDGHSDILNDVVLKRFAGEDHVIEKHHLKKLHKGGIKAINLVVWVEPENFEQYETRQKEILESLYKELNESVRNLLLVRKFSDFEIAEKSSKIAIVLGMEGMASVKSKEHLEYFFHKGVRQGSLTWNEKNDLATGVAGPEDQGLQPLGKNMIEYMQDMRILVDVSHLNEKSFWDVVSISKAPVIASHSNSYSLCNHPRNLKDEQLKKIAELDGVIGVNAWPDFIDTKNPSVQSLVRHIAYIADLVGYKHVSLGFDFCDYLSVDIMHKLNGNDKETLQFENVSKTNNLIMEMRNQGFHNHEIQSISFDNLAKRYKMSMINHS